MTSPRAPAQIDLHTHTIASGHAFNTLYELAQDASAKGLLAFAVTEHGPAMLGAPHAEYFHMSRRIPARLFGTTVLGGCEANIVNHAGELDLPESLLRDQDIVLIGLHEFTVYPADSSKQENTHAIVRAIQNPLVDVIAHPYRPQFPVDIEQIVDAACTHSVLLEVNVSLFHEGVRNPDIIRETLRMVDLLKQRGELPLVSTDAHIALELGDDSALQSVGFNLGPADRWTFLSNQSTRLSAKLRRSDKHFEHLF